MKKINLGKKKIIGVAILVVLVIGGSVGFSMYNQEVKAEQTAKKEKEEYQKLSLQVNDSVKKAYDTRNAKDIEMAEIIIKKLKEKDQKDPKAKMTKLHSFLDLIKKTDQLLATAEKSKKDSDIKVAQNSINEEKDAYVKKDKEAQQKRLDNLKRAIKEQKEKEAKEKAEKEKQTEAKAEQEKVQAQTEAQKQAPDSVAETQVKAPEPNAGTVAQPQPEVPVTEPAGEVPQVNVPNKYEAPQYQAPAPTPAPQPPVAPTPEPPAQPNAPAPQQPNQPVQPPKVWTQEDLDKTAENNSNYDGTKDPNSPWFK